MTSYVKQKSVSYLFSLVNLWNHLSSYNFIIKKYLTSLTKCEWVSFISKTYKVITKSYLTILTKCELSFWSLTSENDYQVANENHSHLRMFPKCKWESFVFTNVNENHSHLRRAIDKPSPYSCGGTQEATGERGVYKHNLIYFAHFNFGTIKRGGIPSEAWQVLTR